MKTVKMKSIAIATAALLILFGINSFAQNQKGRGEGYGKGDGSRQGYHQKSGRSEMYAGLDLTDEQKSKIKEIRLAGTKETTEFQNQIREKEAQLTSLLTQDNPDKTKVKSLIGDIGKLKTENRMDRTDSQMQVRALLTEDQKIIFDQQASRRSGRGGNGSGSFRN